MACANENAAVALLAAGADVHAVDPHGYTPLHKAMFVHARAVGALVDALVKAGANVGALDGESVPPAALAFTAEALEALARNGADMKVTVNGLSLPDYVARNNRGPDVVERRAGTVASAKID